MQNNDFPEKLESTDSDRIQRYLAKERDRSRGADEYNDRRPNNDDGRWPDWYRRARK